MAISFSLCSSSLALGSSHASNRAPRKTRFSMCAKNGISDSPQIRLSESDHHRKKVFEDRSAGIICYKDVNGEITCEGYDEGPRFHQQISRYSSTSRDAEIIDLLQRCWFRAVDENEFKIAGENA